MLRDWRCRWLIRRCPTTRRREQRRLVIHSLQDKRYMLAALPPSYLSMGLLRSYLSMIGIARSSVSESMSCLTIGHGERGRERMRSSSQARSTLVRMQGRERVEEVRVGLPG